MFLLKIIHRTRRIKFSYSSWCSFESRFFDPSLETIKKLFSRKISLKISSAKVKWNDDNLAGINFANSPKNFLPKSDKFLQKKSFLIKKIPPRSFLWTRRREFLETRQLFFSRKCKLFRSKSEKYYNKNTFLWNTWSILFFVTKYLWQKKMLFWRPCRSKVRKSSENFSLKVRKKFWKKNLEEIFFSPKVLGTRGRKCFQPLKYFFSKVLTISLKIPID